MFTGATSVPAKVRNQAKRATMAVSGALEARGVSTPAAKGLSITLILAVVFFTPLACTGAALAAAWLSLALSVFVAGLAACIALGAGLIVCAFVGLAALAGAAFTVTLLITVVVGLAVAHFFACCVAALVATRLCARAGSSVCGRMDSFITLLVSDWLGINLGSSDTSVSPPGRSVTSTKAVDVERTAENNAETVDQDCFPEPEQQQ